MATIRTRSYFTTKFITGYKPVQADYADWLLSTTLKKETADRAKLYTGSSDLSTEQGLTVLATNAQAKANTAQLTDRSLVAQPHQLPTVVAITTATAEDMPTTPLESVVDAGVSTRNKYDIRLTLTWITWLISRLFKAGGTAGQVPVKTDGTDYNWSWVTLSFSQTSGTVPINRGGTGEITASNAINALLPDKTGNALKKLRVNAGATDVEWAADSAPVDTNPVGAMLPYFGVTAPSASYLLCNGAAVSRTTYATLFALIATNYGVGDGSTTFNLPDLKGKFLVGYDPADADYDALTSAKSGGGKTHTLTVDEMPAHSHTYTQIYSPFNGVNNDGDINAGANQSVATPNTSTVGGGDPHENRPPYLTINYLIKVL